MEVHESVRKYLEPEKKVTYEDYVNMPDDGNRYEIINGELLMVPAPSTAHQMVNANIAYELRTVVKKQNLGKVLYAPVDVKFSEENVVQPDIIFISRENEQIITQMNISGAPDMIIEILSPSTAYTDLIRKKELYEKFGVKEYWIVDPLKERVEVFFNENLQFRLFKKIEKQGQVNSKLLINFVIDIETIFKI